MIWVVFSLLLPVVHIILDVISQGNIDIIIIPNICFFEFELCSEYLTGRFLSGFFLIIFLRLGL